MRILEARCARSPLNEPEVLAILNRSGYHSVLWRCPDCRARWVASGTKDSKEAAPAQRGWFGWGR